MRLAGEGSEYWCFSKRPYRFSHGFIFDQAPNVLTEKEGSSPIHDILKQALEIRYEIAAYIIWLNKLDVVDGTEQTQWF